jgi:PAS domain S-box-containing protein
MPAEQLNRNDGQYRSIFDAVYDGLIITDLETGRVVDANPAACSMHGYCSGLL